MYKHSWLFRNLPNLLSTIRIIISVFLIIFIHEPIIFLVLYLVCGLSDVLDGYIARLTGTESALGAKLDSIADMFLTGVIFFFLINSYGALLLSLWPIIVCIGCIRICNIIVAYIKYHNFVILHTYANKATGLLLFFIPIAYSLLENMVFLWIICTVALLSSIEECIIHIKEKELDPNRIGVWTKKVNKNIKESKE